MGYSQVYIHLCLSYKMRYVQMGPYFHTNTCICVHVEVVDLGFLMEI
jgi:hypothetical protein